MHRTATVTAYDMLDQIVVTVTVKQWDQPEDLILREPEFSCTATIPSTGEDEPHEWLAQALLGLLEHC